MSYAGPIQHYRSILEVDAVLFDLDGVLTPTAALHEASWKWTFDAVIERVQGSQAPPFGHDDYVLYVDGRIRRDGARTFLASRGIVLPEDGPGEADTVQSVGERKNQWFREALAAGDLAPFPDAIVLLSAVRAHGLRTGVVSASHNCAAVLVATGLIDRFDVRVDGVVADRDGLRGKPAPDTFMAAAAALHLPPARCAVIEDAVSGVEAGRAGEFALVVGVARSGDGALLRAHGADVVVRELTELLSPPTSPDSR